MNNQPIDTRLDKSIFTKIHEGMHVYDRNGDRIGKVDDIYFGADTDEVERYGAGAASNPDPSLRGNNVVEDVLVAVFGEDDLPETVRARLVNVGFIRIDTAGLFTSARYATRDQIASVTGEDVRLNVMKDELTKP